jgi:indolepyruvate ferredoxin oxidoreductase alpha subunit
LNSNQQEKPKQDFLLGNEAIAWGAIEANIDFIAGYPGTPSSEILETLADYSDEYGIYAEWSTNEMVAFENALGASLAGQRAMVTMKHAGMNWIIDPLSVAVLSGVRGGLVIVTADDPNAHSSANEQDNRFYGLFLKIFTLEPSDPQEARDMTVEAFSLSEKSQLPVILRSVTRVGHSRSNVILNEIPPKDKQSFFQRDPERFFVTGSRALKRHLWQLQQQSLLESLADSLRFNQLIQKGNEKKCIVTSGVAYTYVQDALGILKADNVAILKIGSVFPLPKSLIKEGLSTKETVLVVEEGGPFIEFQLKALASDLSLPVRIFGKMSGDISEAGELNVDIVVKASAKWLGRVPPSIAIRQDVIQEVKEILPPRTMVFCAGCPHTGTMYAVKKVINKREVKPIVTGDIGCYTLMCYPPHELGDAKYSMGTSINVASGLSKALREKAIAIIGDSTFIHAGIPGLINSVYNKSNIMIVICDNRTTAMTGGQPHAGTGMTAMKQETKQLDLEKLITGCGVEFIEVTDPYDIRATEEALERALNYEGVSVVIAQRECALQATREALRLGKRLPAYRVDPEKCIAGDLPFCQAACPLHVDAKGYIGLIREGKYDEALRIIHQTLPFPGIIGRVCTRPCEGECKRKEVDEAIAINAIKRAAADYGKGKFEKDFSLPEEKEERVAVVGGGPAGLMAAYDLRRMGYRVTIFESLPVLGGMLSVGIPEYRLPRDILNTELNIIQKLGVEIKLNTKVGSDVKFSDLKKNFDAIFLAIGAHKGKRLGIENEERKGVVDGVEFLRDFNLGRRIEAKDKVVIVGGGNVALDCARTCLRLGFKEVLVLYRRSREEMPAIKEELQRAQEEGVRVNFLTAPRRVIAQNGQVKGIECLRTKLGEPDASGRRRPIPIKGSELTIETEMIISAVGEEPDLSNFKEVEMLPSVKDSLLLADPLTLETSIPGIFAGGDAVTGPAYVIDALAAGKKAAISIDRYIRGESLFTNREGEGPLKSNFKVSIEGLSKKPRQSQPILSPEQRRGNFVEVEQCFSMNAAKKEAERCLGCECWECIKPLACPAMIRAGDKVFIESSLCPGCGICAQICPEKAIIQESA